MKLINFYNTLQSSLILLFFATQSSCSSTDTPTFQPPVSAVTDAKFYLTTPSKSSLLELQSTGTSPLTENSNFTINVNPNATFQTMDGFGYTLTGGSAQLIQNMSVSAKNALLEELFGQGPESIKVSYLRISVGASDLDASVFSYNDLAAGQTDVALTNFSIAPDLVNLIPILNQIKTLNPNIKIVASPWSAPTWMKSNQSSVGGELQPIYYQTYANYFVKYIQAMQANNIAIDAITIQNEPENPYNNPSMLMTAPQQGLFIKNFLGPAFAANNIQTKIILFDHNLDNPNYPISILNDAATKQYVDGSAFHLYAGQIENMSLVHNAHPDKNVYFTEQWVQAPGNFASDIKWHFRELMIGAPRNWSKTVLQWNLAADPNSNPHTPGGCTECLGAITIDGSSFTRNPAYYIIAHSSKFVPPGSVRIESNSTAELPNVAYKTPEGKIVVVVLNNTESQKSFNINVAIEPISTTLPAGAVATFVW
ncbi:glycoside hydrolase family 30 beta sandwich domain-containing protein [Flavobacterium sp.]|jgi:glucosylceramidase|uniref:glycoside hydrolase family 30 protein n=1 Tax=Flavobacterium sp. TaxID=239 RepID=UPI0037C18DF0